MRPELCVQIFQYTCNRRGVRGFFVYCDQGTQLTSQDYIDRLRIYKVIQSLRGAKKHYDTKQKEGFCDY